MRFMTSVQNAWKGIRVAFISERHLRFHGLAALSALIGALILQFSFIEWIIVILVVIGMISLELVNTAIETVVDLVQPEWHQEAGKAKDIAAGACLIYACGAAVIGVMLYIPKLINWLI